MTKDYITHDELKEYINLMNEQFNERFDKTNDQVNERFDKTNENTKNHIDRIAKLMNDNMIKALALNQEFLTKQMNDRFDSLESKLDSFHRSFKEFTQEDLKNKDS